MTIATQRTTKHRVVSTVELRHSVRTARRDEGGRLAGVDEVAWTGQAGLVPVEVVTGMIEEAVAAVAPQIEAAASEAIDGWLAQNTLALPEPLAGELAADYFAEIRAAILDGRIPAGAVFALPRTDGGKSTSGGVE